MPHPEDGAEKFAQTARSDVWELIPFMTFELVSVKPN